MSKLKSQFQRDVEWQAIRSRQRQAVPVETIDAWPGELDLPRERPLTEEEASRLLHHRIGGGDE